MMLNAPTLKFLHSMRERSYLEQALCEGLLLRDHPVRCATTDEPSERLSNLKLMEPLLELRLKELGTSWSELTVERQQSIVAGLGSIRGQIPMLCFTEVPEGREIAAHNILFGAYGVVVHRSWLERMGADRVVYIGDNSSVSRGLYRLMASLLVSTLVRSEKGEVLFLTQSLGPVLELLSHIETRSNVEEFEWRIAGRHGFMGGGRDVGKRLPLPIRDVQAVLVQNEDDVVPLSALVSQLAAAQGESCVPTVMWQPTTL
jgi:hypothetical protein